MVKILGALVFLLAGFSGFSQDYYAECISTPGYLQHDVKVNNTGEIFISASTPSYPSKFVLFKLNADGIEVWKKEFAEDIRKFWLDDSGNSYVETILYENNSSIRGFHKVRPDGTDGWNAATFAFPSQGYSQIVVNGQGNIYFLSEVNHTNNSSRDIYISKYTPTGNFQWQTMVTNNAGYPSPSVVVNQTGEAFVATKLYAAGLTPATVEVRKLSSNGVLGWKSDLTYANNTSAFNLTLTPTIYIDLSGNIFEVINYSRVVYFSVDSDEKYTILARVNASSGLRTGYLTLPSDSYNNYNVLTAFKGNNTFVLAPSSIDARVLQLTDNLTIVSEFTIAGYYFGFGTSLLVNELNAIYYASEYNLMKIANGVMAWEFSKDDYSVGIAFDAKNRLITTNEYCLTRFNDCGTTQVTLTSQPANQEVCPGENATFRATGSGVGLGYYWYKGPMQLRNSTKFEGANSPVLTVKQSDISDVGSYYCEVRDGCGEIIKTQNVTLTVISPPSITEHPQSIVECDGAYTSLRVRCVGGKNVKYQWKKGSTSLLESGLLIGTKSNTLVLRNISTADAGEYFCEVTADCTTPLASQKATLGIQSQTVITKNPENITSCTGSNIVFSITASGANLSYQWKKEGNELGETSRIVGSKTSTLTLSQLQVADAGEYTCLVSGSCSGSVVSSKAILSVAEGQQIISHPLSRTICSNSNVSFSVTVSGIGATYQWMKGNSVLSDNNKYSGVAGPTLSVVSASVAEEGTYTCAIATSCGDQLTSNAAHLDVGTPAAIVERSTDMNLCSGELAKFAITTSGDVVGYRWKKDGISIIDNVFTTGSNTNALFINNVTALEAGGYTCEITSPCGPASVSNVIKLAVREQIVLTGQPKSKNICESEDLILEVSATGYAPTFQWKLNGANLTDANGISGAKGERLRMNNVKSDREGYYICEVNGCGGVVSSEPVLITINPKPDLAPVDPVDCDNLPITWSSLVIDDRNTNGEYFLYPEGSTEPINLSSIASVGNYFIVKQAQFCFDTLLWNNTCVITITGIEDNLVLDFVISPNPTNRWITLRYNPEYTKDFEVYDPLGTVIASGDAQDVGETSLDGNLWASGMYLVRVRDKKGHFGFRRFILQR